MKETLIFLSHSKMNYRDISEAKSADERRKLVGTSFTFSLFVVFDLIHPLIG